MPIFPFNPNSDERVYSSKKTITSLDKEDKTQCLSPYGPVSNMNCPTNNPYCNCPTAAKGYAPNFRGYSADNSPIIDHDWDEPSETELALLKDEITECKMINEVLGPEWMGIDFSNPHSLYNCDYCFYNKKKNVNATGAYVSLPGLTTGWQPYFSDPADPQSYYYRYDSRSVFFVKDKDTYAYAFPDYTVTGMCGPAKPANDECKDFGGFKFKWYKEYSKTSATFWNTPPYTPLLRKAQTALLGAQRIKILTHGDLRARPGKLIYINYPNFGGRWMIYKVQRVITAQKHSMYLYLMRDGVG